MSWRTRFIETFIVLAVSVGVVVAATTTGHAYVRPGTTTQVDLDRTGKSPDGSWCKSSSNCAPTSNGGDQSHNGRWIAFESNAPDLVNGDTNESQDIFVRDTWRNSTVRASVSSSEAQAEDISQGLLANRAALSRSAAISGNGRFVAFVSSAANLVPGDTNLEDDVFVRDLRKGTTERVSVDSRGMEKAPREGVLIATVANPSLDMTGKYVAFESDAPDLLALDPKAVITRRNYIYLRERKPGTTTLVSLNSDEEPADDHTYHPHLSSNGRYMAFWSTALNLVENDTNSSADAFVRDLQEGTTHRVSIATDGKQGTYYPELPTAGGPADYNRTVKGLSPTTQAVGVSDDGDVAFVSDFTNLVPADAMFDSSGSDYFVHSLKSGRTIRVTVGSAGQSTNDFSPQQAFVDQLSADGRFVVFRSWASNLAVEDSDGQGDLFLHDTVTGSTELLSVTNRGTHLSADGLVPGGDKVSYYSLGGISGNGRHVTIRTPKALTGEEDSSHHVFVRDRGEALGTDGFIGSDHSSGSRARSDEPPAALAAVGADLVEGSVVARPETRDLFFRLGVSELPWLGIGRTAIPPVSYGWSLSTPSESFVLTSAGGVAHDAGLEFQLNRCDDQGLCLPDDSFKGYYGTTGFEVVVAVPMDALNLSQGETITSLRGFTTLAPGGNGPTILDELEFSQEL